MTRAEWLKAPKKLQGWENYGRAKKLLNPGNVPNVVLHHKNFNCTNYEQWVVDELVPMFKWCHIGFHGRFTSVETREKIAKANRGKRRSKASRQLLAERKMGNRYASGKRSDEFRQRMSVVNKGKTLSEVHRVNISEALKGKPSRLKGKELPEETRQKMKRRIPWNKGLKGAQAAWNKGISMVPEQKAKLSETHTERLKNPAAREKCLANLRRADT